VVAIARLGSFRAAALDLDVSPTAIGNAVASLGTALAFACSTARRVNDCLDVFAASTRQGDEGHQ
jgi:Bacterial regulatory helix-turn-helix protein, lysR family